MERCPCCKHEVEDGHFMGVCVVPNCLCLPCCVCKKQFEDWNGSQHNLPLKKAMCVMLYCVQV